MPIPELPKATWGRLGGQWKAQVTKRRKRLQKWKAQEDEREKAHQRYCRLGEIEEEAIRRLLKALQDEEVTDPDEIGRLLMKAGKRTRGLGKRLVDGLPVDLGHGCRIRPQPKERT